jgi:signal transduction histidine kinase/DNA-binding response OmpR family regulator
MLPNTTERVVLIIDSSAEVDAARVQWLTAAGFQVEVARDAGQALAVLRARAIVAVVLVTAVLDASAAALTHSLKREPQGSALAVIVLARASSAEERLLLLQAGAEEVLTGPVEGQELCVRLQNLLRLSAARAPTPAASTQPPARWPAQQTQAEPLAQGVLHAAIITDAPDIVCVLDSSGTLKLLNRTISGRSVDEVLGRCAYDVLLEPAAAALKRTVSRALLSDDLVCCDADFVDALGAPARYSLRARRVRAVPDRVVVFANDITSTRRSELTDPDRLQQLDQSRERSLQGQKMEAIGRLAGGVAHDFNNLLTSIICFTRFVADELDDADPRRHDLSEVLRAADSASRLTNQLLAFSRGRAAAPSAFGVNTTLGTVDRLLRRTLGEQIELVMVPSDVPLSVFMDPGHFEQLILNLILNARDAMPDGGTATLAVEKRLVTGERGLVDSAVDGAVDGEYVVITVTDTGVGMNSSIAAQVFEPFFTTKGDKGTGLGLATCYAIVREAGGKITVESGEGAGSTFRVFLPSVDESQKIDPRRSASLPPFAFTGTVLIVEDQPMLARTIARTLSAAGLAIEQARSAEDALAMRATRSDRVQLLVADVVLPGMSGVRLAERLREHQPDLRVLFVSGYSPDSAEAEMHLDARTAFLAKPFNNKQLLMRAAALLAPAAATAS